MSKVRTTHAKRVPPKARRKSQPQKPASLPLPAVADTTPVAPQVALTSANEPAKRIEKRTWREKEKLPSNSIVRQRVLSIVAMKVAGKSKAEISAELGITEGTINQYMYLAGRNGWLSKRAVDPNDRLEFEITHKVVRNLDEMLDSPNEERRDQATLKTAEGMLFKKFAEQQSAPPLAVIGIRIEMPANGQLPTIREDTGGGTPRWGTGTDVIDAESKRVDVDAGSPVGGEPVPEERR